MSLNPSVIPRRLAQPHGAYFNAVLSPNITVTRKYGGRHRSTKNSAITMLEKKEVPGMNAAEQNMIRRFNENLAFTGNDEVFDCRAGEPLVSSFSESGYSPHGRGFVFSSVNGYTSTTGASDPNEALYKSDCQFVGLCQSDFTSANAALQEQGLAVQCSGIKTILNDSAGTSTFLLSISFFLRCAYAVLSLPLLLQIPYTWEISSCSISPKKWAALVAECL